MNRIILILSLLFSSVLGYSIEPGSDYSDPGFSLYPETNFIAKTNFNSIDGLPKVKNWKLKRINFKLSKKLQTKFENENPKVVSLGLALTLGIFGTHRLYLGTHHRVPIFYTLTLGGSGIILLVDIVTILTTDDLEKFRNNSKFIMW